MQKITGNCLECGKSLYRPNQKYCSRDCRKIFEDKHFVRRCTSCDKTPEQVHFATQLKSRDGLRSLCQECTNKYARKKYQMEPASERSQRRRKINQLPQKQEARLMLEYGITLSQVESLLKAQNENCGICHQNFSKEHFYNVDHSHLSGNVRGLLCRKCNLGLGVFYDNAKLLANAKKYLLSIHIPQLETLLWRQGESRVDFRPNRRLRVSQTGKQRLLRWQGNMCPICETPAAQVRNFHLDHDHDQGHIRGLLCETCNFGLGHFRDNPDLLTAAVAYLDAATDK